MVYAKIENKQIVFAPREVEISGETVKFPTEEQLFSLGFMRVVFTQQPEAPIGFSYEPTWSEQNGEVVQGWELVELPPEEATAEDYENALADLGVRL